MRSTPRTEARVCRRGPVGVDRRRPHHVLGRFPVARASLPVVVCPSPVGRLARDSYTRGVRIKPGLLQSRVWRDPSRQGIHSANPILPERCWKRSPRRRSMSLPPVIERLRKKAPNSELGGWVRGTLFDWLLASRELSPVCFARYR